MALVALPLLLAWVLGTWAAQVLGLPAAWTATTPAAPPPPSTRPCSAATFRRALPGYAVVERVDTVPAGGAYGEAAGANLAFPLNATGLPAVCAVTVHVQNGSSDHRFALFLPLRAAQWNARFLAVGSYSFAGGLNWPDMGQGPHYGFATLGSDTGHRSAPDALDWAPTTDDKLVDWGWRALHEAVPLGKRLTAAYYGDTPARYAYFSGCSTGGRQGLKAVQMAPADAFDGVVVGAPAWDTSSLMPWITRLGAANLPEDAPHRLGLAEMAVLAAAALRQCDALDGHNDSIVSRPDNCQLDWQALQCGGSEAADRPSSLCLTPAQMATARSVYADAYTARGDFLHVGMSPGSEDQWYAYLAYGAERDFDTRYERFWLYNDTAWDATQYTDQTVYDSWRINPGQATVDDFASPASPASPAASSRHGLAAYRARGGKVLMYQGLADGVVPPRGTTRFYHRTMAALRLGASDMDQFFRYVRVPGMQHCFSTPPEVQAPWMFGAPAQATFLLQNFQFGDGWGVPGQPPSAAHDALLALVAWVEDGQAPDQLVATAWHPDGTVYRTRPLCVYPAEAVYKGTGDENEAANWECR